MEQLIPTLLENGILGVTTIAAGWVAVLKDRQLKEQSDRTLTTFIEMSKSHLQDTLNREQETLKTLQEVINNLRELKR